MKQALLDQIRFLNKRFTNKIMIQAAGRRFGLFAVLSHTGRRSGKTYRIPVITFPVRDGFIFALTYGRNVDWYKNVIAAGGCGLRWKNKDYRLIHPQQMAPDTALPALPPLFRAGLRMAKVQDYIKLQINPVTSVRK